MKEIWKDIKGYEGLYQISNLGRVKSLSRKHKMKKNGSYMTKEFIMKNMRDKCGYLYIHLSKDNKIKEYPSMREAQRQTKISYIDISSVCKNKRKTAGGYKWEFKKI